MLKCNCFKLTLFLYRYSLQEVKETGILKRISEYVWPPKYVEFLEEYPPSVTMETVIIFFILLTCGIVACVIIILLEVIVNKFRYKSSSYK
jgi:hypothetical protein